MRASPEYYKVERSTSSNARPSSRESNIDVYMGASMLVNMRQGRSPPVRSYSPDDSYERRKRYYYPEDYQEKDKITQSKRQKLMSEPKKSNFNISSLLGLDDVSDKPTKSRSSAFTELITRSYISAGSRYERYGNDSYGIPIRNVYEKWSSDQGKHQPISAFLSLRIIVVPSCQICI